MKFLLLALAMTLLSTNVNAEMTSEAELEMHIEKQMGQPVVQKISNHFYNAKQSADGFNVVSIFWTGKKVFKKDNACLVMEQKLSHIETLEGEGIGDKLKEPVLTQQTRVTDCKAASFLI